MIAASSPDRLHAAACGGIGDDSHTSGQPDAATIHHYHQLPVHDFELSGSCTKGDHDLLVPDGRLPPISTSTTSVSEERVRVFTRPAAVATKQRAAPPTGLTLKIPEHPRAGIEWQIESQSTSTSPATHIALDHSGVGAGYFSVSTLPRNILIFIFARYDDGGCLDDDLRFGVVGGMSYVPTVSARCQRHVWQTQTKACSPRSVDELN